MVQTLNAEGRGSVRWDAGRAVPEARRRNMSAITRRDTAPELALRRALHSLGLRYRVDFAPVDPRRRADIVFTRMRLAIFVDGCFWHGCPLHYRRPKSNGDYWPAKIALNVARDEDSTRRLEGEGWEVLRVWAHEDMGVIAGFIASKVRARHGESARSSSDCRLLSSSPKRSGQP